MFYCLLVLCTLKGNPLQICQFWTQLEIRADHKTANNESAGATKWQDSYNEVTDHVRWTMLDALKVKDTQRGKAELRACAAVMYIFSGCGRVNIAPAVEELRAYLVLHTVKKRILGQHPVDRATGKELPNASNRERARRSLPRIGAMLKEQSDTLWRLLCDCYQGESPLQRYERYYTQENDTPALLCDRLAISMSELFAENSWKFDKDRQPLGPSTHFKEGTCIHYRPDSQPLGFLARAAFDFVRAELPLSARKQWDDEIDANMGFKDAEQASSCGRRYPSIQQKKRKVRRNRSNLGPWSSK